MPNTYLDQFDRPTVTGTSSTPSTSVGASPLRDLMQELEDSLEAAKAANAERRAKREPVCPRHALTCACPNH